MSPTMNAIGIVSKDMKRSLEFYRVLGVGVPVEIPEGEDHVEAQLGNGVKLMWDTVELVQSFSPDFKHPGGSCIGLAFQCESPSEVDAVYQRLVDAGFESEKEPWDAFWGMRYAIVKDPDGNSTSLYALLG